MFQYGHFMVKEGIHVLYRVVCGVHPVPFFYISPYYELPCIKLLLLIRQQVLSGNVAVRGEQQDTTGLS